MSETSTQTQAEGEVSTEESDSEVMARFRKEAEAGKAAVKELAALKRERAFDLAGIPTDGPAKWFRAGYDGEVDVEAIRAAAVADSLIAAPDQTDPQIVDDALDQAGRISEAASGTQASPTVEALLADAKTMDEIEAIASNAGVGVPIR